MKGNTADLSPLTSDLDPRGFLGPQESAPKLHLDRFSHFCIHCSKNSQSQCFSKGWTTPKNCSFPLEELESYPIHSSLAPPKSASQTASRSVQSFLFCRDLKSDEHTYAQTHKHTQRTTTLLYL